MVQVVISWACLFVFVALKLNFIDWSTLLVFSAALLSGRMLAPLGRRVLSEMQPSIEACLRNISWSEHVVPILSDFIEVLPDLVNPIVYSITGWQFNVVVKNSKLLKQVFSGMMDRLLCIPIIWNENYESTSSVWSELIRWGYFFLIMPCP